MPRNMSIDEQLKGLSSHTPAMDASDNVAAVGSRHGSMHEASPYPATITEGFLWLGDHKHASTDGVMRDLKITHVVDAAHDDPAGEIRRGQYPDLTYLVLRVNDDESSDLTAAFADSHKFINECRAAEELNPVDNGDAHLVQVNQIALDRMGAYSDKISSDNATE